MIITFPSALEYWLGAADTPSSCVSAEEIILSPYSCSEDHLLQAASSFHLKQPLHIMVPFSSQRHLYHKTMCHLIPKNLPRDSFVKIADSFFIVRPELCFLLAACSYDVPELVKTANDLCSIFRRNTESVFRQSPREQITDTKQISFYLAQVRNCKGIKKARRAIRYASDRSNSPMESILAAIARLPFLLGGVSLSDFFLNYYIHLAENAAAFLGKESCCCDIVWPKQKLAVEYDSSLAHLSAGQHNYDKKRATALMMSGYNVVNMSWGHLNNIRNTETIFLELRRMLGLKTDMTRFQKYAAQREKTLKKLLYQID